MYFLACESMFLSLYFSHVPNDQKPPFNPFFFTNIIMRCKYNVLYQAIDYHFCSNHQLTGDLLP